MAVAAAAPAAIEVEETSVIATQSRWKIGAGALRAVLASAGALLVLTALLCASAGAAESAVAPLPASDYTVRHVCAAPAPEYAGCLALELVPRTEAARARTHPLGITRSRPIVAAKASEGAFGLRPQDLHSIYQLPTTVASTQTIALVDAYNDLSAEADLKVYDKEFGLSECTAANKCFEQLNQNGKSGKLPFPASNVEREKEEATCETATGKVKEEACKEVEEADGWSEEISLDIEVSHATCQSCKIMLVEAESASFPALEEAEKTAAGLGATEISNSWGGPEQGETPALDEASPFNHPGTVITAAAGDDGYLDWGAEHEEERGFADYPASSPHVVAVGGTRLLGPLGPEGTWAGETVWNGDGAGGSGCSVELAAPIWQQSTSDWESVGCGEHRAVADVSADADPYTGVAMYDSSAKCEYETHIVSHWCTIGGTSLASPLIASVFALAGGAGGVEYPAETLYEHETEDPTTLHDVLSGSNGKCAEPFNEEEGLSGCAVLQEAANCSDEAICLAREGYDGPSGIGTPNGITAFKPVSEEVKRKNEEKRRAEKQLREEKKKEEEAAKNPGGGSTTGTSTISTGSISLANGASGGSFTGTTTPSIDAGAPIIKLSAFALTPSALLTLHRVRPKVSSVGFAFTISAAARVRASIAKRVRVRGREQWVFVPGSVTFAAAKGSNRRHLTSRDGLTPGSYRLTLTPQHGSARSIVFQIG
jgi:Subtilase family